jgi:signal transduction histidine kinase
MGEPVRLQQIAWNLVSNAIKFTDPGGKVSITTGLNGTQSYLTVVDTGIGIEPEFLPHVFDRFRQADGSTSRRHGGLGLGLAIADALAKLL